MILTVDIIKIRNGGTLASKPKVTIFWGTKGNMRTKKTYVFENEEQKSFFMKGVKEANGWLEYEEAE